MSSNQLVYVVSSRHQFTFPHVKNSCAAEIPHFKFWITEHLVRLGEQEFFLRLHNKIAILLANHRGDLAIVVIQDIRKDLVHGQMLANFDIATMEKYFRHDLNISFWAEIFNTQKGWAAFQKTSPKLHTRARSSSGLVPCTGAWNSARL